MWAQSPLHRTTESTASHASAATFNYDPSLLHWRSDSSLLPPPEQSTAHAYASWAIRRFKIAICTVPFVCALLLLRWLLWMDPKNPSVAAIDSTIVAPVITCVVFVMSTVFSNVISDYKESEKIPAELVSYFQALMSIAVSEARVRRFDHRPMCRQIELMLLAVLSTLDESLGEGGFRQTSWGFQCASTNFLVLLQRGRDEGQHDHVVLEVVQHAIGEIKKKWTRIHDIGRLSIVLPAYTVMDVLCVLLSAILLCADYKAGAIPPSSALMAISVFAYVAFYLNLMVRSLDDPFDSPGQFQYLTYTRSKAPIMSLWEVWCFPTLIDFACVTEDMGANLRRLIRCDEHELEGLLHEHTENFKQ